MTFINLCSFVLSMCHQTRISDHTVGMTTSIGWAFALIYLTQNADCMISLPKLNGKILHAAHVCYCFAMMMAAYQKRDIYLIIWKVGQNR
jgi:hypothetical protein